MQHHSACAPPACGRAMIRLRNLCLTVGGAANGGRGRIVLDQANCDIPQGGFRWLLGPSGAGKSTLLRALQLAHPPERGTLEVLGADPAHAGRRATARLRRRIGAVHQDYRLLPELSVFDNVALPLRLDGMAERSIREEVDAILSWLRISPLRDRSPRYLSGGEQQRTAIARALVKRPGLLLADEPTNALDETESLRLVRLFEELSGLGTTVVIATHNPALPRLVPARALVLDGRGQMVESAP
ncbi:cell division ATP-binding protein FtsE [Tanticharoenia sakaeratensis NBRC 103193]|uniref:Cell division ATP-binding protein FtsE n=2 Tax=Tanticharoenia TaxID=444052 RepID=A0A0D6MJQ6_9PROT|nr:ATP-binding cassette domain-containing protein [Tanticharoenia sakaeratensis]GAN53716.1 cell division ATP-binding protein FtsE [Tanticharoenia sakaeratensis NBRC 103193]